MPALVVYEYDDEAVSEGYDSDNTGPIQIQRRTRGPRRIPKRLIEPHFPQFHSLESEWPRSTNNKRGSFKCDDPDFIMEVQQHPIERNLLYACGWKHSKDFIWLSDEEVKAKYSNLLLKFYQRPNDFVDRHQS